ncbi:MAG: glycine/betaine/sarcosine/D-proline family reductase selenoprotein B [Chloroflexi bacterium]|nr:glycine/betaine/sarcosine/D-proline family reductase selenoprotein B [Chloroflexota bacterium]
MSNVRLVHFLNQFFAGEGGEEKADLPLSTKEGPVGPGRRLQALLGESAEIVATACCGDNYFAPHREEVIASILEIARKRDIQGLVAGPSFSAGRYGFACVEVCHAASASLGLRCVTAMHLENPGIEAYRQYVDQGVFALPTSEDASGMEDALSRIAKFIGKLAAGSRIGSASDEGYIRRGIRMVEFRSKNGAERAIEMMLAKAAERPFVTEIRVESVDPIPVLPPMASLGDACLALVSTSGVVPKGNPDGFKGNRNTQWRKYSVDGLASMQDIRWDVMHGGYNTQFMEQNPNYGVPLDACRRLEKEGVLGKLYPFHYVTTGVGALFSDMQVVGTGIVQDMRAEGVDAAILVAT